jgi:hypothetical protein
MKPQQVTTGNRFLNGEVTPRMRRESLPSTSQLAWQSRMTTPPYFPSAQQPNLESLMAYHRQKVAAWAGYSATSQSHVVPSIIPSNILRNESQVLDPQFGMSKITSILGKRSSSDLFPIEHQPSPSSSGEVVRVSKKERERQRRTKINAAYERLAGLQGFDAQVRFRGEALYNAIVRIHAFRVVGPEGWQLCSTKKKRKRLNSSAKDTRKEVSPPTKTGN